MVILIKVHYLTGLSAFLSPIYFSQVNFHIYNNSVKICAVWVTQKYATAFLKSVKQKPIFHKHSNDKEFWEEKQTNLTIEVLYETTQEIVEKNC